MGDGQVLDELRPVLTVVSLRDVSGYGNSRSLELRSTPVLSADGNAAVAR